MYAFWQKEKGFIFSSYYAIYYIFDRNKLISATLVASGVQLLLKCKALEWFVPSVVGAVDADHQAGVQDHQTVGGHWIPGRRPQDGLQRNGHAGAGQSCVSPMNMNIWDCHRQLAQHHQQLLLHIFSMHWHRKPSIEREQPALLQCSLSVGPGRFL